MSITVTPNKRKTLIDQYIKGAKNYLGLDSFVLDIFMEHGYFKPTYTINFSRSIEIDPFFAEGSITNILSEHIIDPMIRDIQNSPAVQEAKKELTDKIVELEQQVSSLKEEVDRLKPFENYFNLEKELRTGNKDDK